MTGISSAITSSTAMIKKDQSRMTDLSYVKYMLQTFKTQGKDTVKNYYEPILVDDDKTPDDDTPYDCYFYFNDDNTNDLASSLENHSFTEGSLDDMKSNHGTSASKRYGAYIKFTTCKRLSNSDESAGLLDSTLDNVRVEVSVTDFLSPAHECSSAVLYIGR